MKKSTLFPSSQSGAGLTEILLGAGFAALLITITIVFVQSTRENQRVERTLSALYSLKEEVKKVNRSQGSYTQGRMLPLLFAAKAFPDSLNVDYDNRRVTTPMGHLLDVTGRGQHFSIDLQDLTPNDCYDIGSQIIAGNFFMLGNTSDDLDAVKIGQQDFTDKTPLTSDTLEKACTEALSIDLIMAFR